MIGLHFMTENTLRLDFQHGSLKTGVKVTLILKPTPVTGMLYNTKTGPLDPVF